MFSFSLSIRSALIILSSLSQSLIASKDWNQFRGPNGDGDAGDSNPPISFSPQENLTWQTSLKGKAWSSPVLRDGVIWVTNAQEDGKHHWAHQFDWKTGRELNKILVFKIPTPQFCHPMNSYATNENKRD